MNKNFEDQSLGKSVAIFAVSSSFGIAGLVGTGWLFNTMNWPYFHTWALGHGSAPICFLFWAFIGYHSAKLVFHSTGQFSPIPNVAYVCSALGTFFPLSYLPFTYYNLNHFMWAGIVLASIGVYTRLRNGNKAAVGLTWTAFIVSILDVSYWAHIKILFWNMHRSQ